MIFKLIPTPYIRWQMYINTAPYNWKHIGNPSSKTDIATLIAYYEREKR